MKRVVFASIVLAAVFTVASCGTTPASSGPTAGQAPQRRVSGGVPPSVMDWIINQPEGTLVGIGTANLPTVNMSMELARTRATTHIAQQLGQLVNNMVTDYMAASEVTQDALGFQETITRALTEQTVTGAQLVALEQDANGNWWAVQVLDRTRTSQTVNDAVNNLNPSFGAAMGALDRMDRAFEQLNEQPLVPVSN